MYALQEGQFRRKVDSALISVKTILHNARDPQYAQDVPHTYQDKYALAEFLTNAALAAQLNALEALGLTEKALKKMISWAEDRSVTLCLKSEEKCVYDREETRKVESATEYVTEVKGSIFGNAKRTEKVITKITEYFWKYSIEYELFVYKGNDPSEKISLQSRTGRCEIVTSTKSSPQPEVYIHPSVEVNITWLLKNINASDGIFQFRINREIEECRTPRRNPDIYRAFIHFDNFDSWCTSVSSYFRNKIFGIQQSHSLDLGAVNASTLFVPILPLFEEGADGKQEKKKIKEGEDATPKSASLIAPPPTVVANPDSSASVVLPWSDINTFLWEQKRSFSEKFADLAKIFPAKDAKDAKLITVAETSLVILTLHGCDLCSYFHDGIEYIENMLYKQLLAAIGKEVTPVDFSNYMRFHNRKLFRTAFEPRPFCHAIRRPDHYPEGTISIECQLDDGSLADPIYTSTRRIAAGTPGAGLMNFPINAATNVVFGGDRYLHAWISHEFEGSSGQNLSLVARARQFSSFILVVGRIASAEVFDPKAAIIIQNKDDLRIPLMLETIPTPKEFRDAIASMSPEQQRFCKAYRSMQLESTLFGLVVIQIKPQLEKLLNLQYDSLTKEIRLTQDLMELFMKYQVPSDLLSFDLEQFPNAPVDQRLSAVKKHVQSMYEMLNASKAQEIQQAQQQQLYRALDRDETPVIKEKYKEKEKSEKSYKDKKAPMKKMMKKEAPVRSRSAAPQQAQQAPLAKPQPAPAPTPAPAATVATPAPSSSSQPEPAPQSPREAQTAGDATPTSEDVSQDIIDFTQIPSALDEKFELLDEDSALRPTIINVGTTWSMKFQNGILASQESKILNAPEQANERNRAFDLLDALSRSGSLAIDYAELHVVVAATHCFDKSVIDTVIQDNINPIEKVERSVLIVSSTIQDRPPVELIKGDQQERVKTYSPMLFTAPVPQISQ